MGFLNKKEKFTIQKFNSQSDPIYAESQVLYIDETPLDEFKTLLMDPDFAQMLENSHTEAIVYKCNDIENTSFENNTPCHGTRLINVIIINAQNDPVIYSKRGCQMKQVVQSDRMKTVAQLIASKFSKGYSIENCPIEFESLMAAAQENDIIVLNIAKILGPLLNEDKKIKKILPIAAQYCTDLEPFLGNPHTGSISRRILLATDVNGCNHLVSAIKVSNHANVVFLMAFNFFNVNKVSGEFSPMQLAKQEKNLQIIQILTKNKAAVSIETDINDVSKNLHDQLEMDQEMKTFFMVKRADV